MSNPYVAALPDGLTRDSVAMLPMFGVFAIAAAVVRAIRRTDEYGQRKLLGNLAATGGLTMMWALGYAMLERAGWPRLSMSSVWIVVSIAWLVCTFADAFHRIYTLRRR